jgi:hypothetical protein
MAATGFRTIHVPRVYAAAGPAYGAGVLALYTHVGVGERALGALTWRVLLARCGHCRPWPARRRSGWSRSRPSAAQSQTTTLAPPPVRVGLTIRPRQPGGELLEHSQLLIAEGLV